MSVCVSIHIVYDNNRSLRIQYLQIHSRGAYAFEAQQGSLIAFNFN